MFCAEWVQPTLDGKVCADETFWTTGDRYGIMWPSSGHSEPLCQPKTPFRAHCGPKIMIWLLGGYVAQVAIPGALF